MSRRKPTTPANIEKRIREGRGQGEGAGYNPTLKIQDVPSQGTRYRAQGKTTGRREHHYLSGGERHYHSILDYSEAVIDIREQWGLNLEATIQIAQQLDIKHPQDNESGLPVQMTTDFFITVADGSHERYLARTLKPSHQLTERTLEKFEIERTYFQLEDIDWGIVTEKEIPEAIWRNLARLLASRNLKGAVFAEANILKIKNFLEPKVLQADEPLNRLSSLCDNELGIKPGSSLRVVYYLLSNRIWRTDLTSLIVPSKPLKLLKVV